MTNQVSKEQESDELLLWEFENMDLGSPLIRKDYIRDLLAAQKRKERRRAELIISKIINEDCMHAGEIDLLMKASVKIMAQRPGGIFEP